MGMLLLALALVFNDLKGLALMRDAIAGMPPKPFEISEHAGEWGGLELQMYRYQVSVLHELFKALSSFTSVLESEEFRALVASMPANAKGQWDELVAIASGTARAEETELGGLLARIRNSIGFHYYNPKTLADGFQYVFAGEGQHDGTRQAWASFGKNMEETRFYYADAAVQGALVQIQGKLGNDTFRRQMKRVHDATNESLRFLLEAYWRRRL
jgi:hypothetical protein